MVIKQKILTNLFDEDSSLDLVAGENTSALDVLFDLFEYPF